MTSAAGLHGLEELVLKVMLTTVAPIAAICIAVGLIANVAQVGLKPRMKALSPEFARLNPASGAKRLFGKRAGFEAGKSLAKVTVVAGAAALSLIPMITHSSRGIGATPAALGALMFAGAKTIATGGAAVYIVIGVIDYIWQKRQFEQGLKMTKQEIKDESRNQDLPPEVRSAIRRRRILAARARMMAAVPKAYVRTHQPDPLRRRARLRRHQARPDRGRQGQEPDRRPDPQDRDRERRPDRARPAAGAVAPRERRDRPDDSR